MKLKIVASIEARMSSTRLPGKVLMKTINGDSMLEFMVKRLKKSKYIHEIIIATTINKADDPIVDLCEGLKIKYYRGSESDVLIRVLNAHVLTESNVIVELTGDCPLIDVNLVDNIILKYLNNDFDYVSNSHIRSYPDGFDVQVFPFKLLKEISLLTDDPYDRENVSSFIYRSGKYSTYGFIADNDEFWPELRVTLDDKGDYELINEIIFYFNSINKLNFSVKDVIIYLRNNIKLLELNKDARVSTAPDQKIAKSPYE